MFHHAVGVDTQSGLASNAFFEMREDVHLGGVPPHKEGFIVLCGAIEEVKCLGIHFFIDRLHTLLRQRTRISHATVRKTVNDTAWSKLLLELRVLWVVAALWFFLCIQVIEVAKELIEPVRRRKHLIAIAKVILAELTSDVAARLQKRGDGGVFLFDSLGCARKSNFGETSTNGRLTRDERRATSGATLLAIPISKECALFGDAINVGRLVAHHALVVCTDVELTDVVTPNHQDVGLLVGLLNGGLGSLSARRHGAHADGNGHERSD